MKKLIIIGNGFDLNHGVRSEYKDFRKFAMGHNPNWSYDFEQYIPDLSVRDWWNFEQQMGRVDAESISESMLQLSASIGDDDFARSITGKEYLLSNLNNVYGQELDNIFYQWLQSLTIPKSKSPQTLNSQWLYLTFNYTETLQEAYEVSNERVLHIHGCRNDEDSIVLGHRDNQQYIPPIEIEHNYSFNFAEGDTDFEGINSLVSNLMENRYKPIEEIIQKNESFFMGLSDFSEIFVLGHSLSKVDLPYFRKIRSCVPDSSIWSVSYRGKSSKIKHQSALDSIGISADNYRLLPLAELLKNYLGS